MALAKCSSCHQWANESTGKFTPGAGRQSATFLCADCVTRGGAVASPPPTPFLTQESQPSTTNPATTTATPQPASSTAGTGTTTTPKTGWFGIPWLTPKVAGAVLLAAGLIIGIWAVTKDDEGVVGTACRLTAGGVTTLAGLARTEQAGLAILATYGISEACEPLLKSLIDKPEENVTFTLVSDTQTEAVTVPGLDLTALLTPDNTSPCYSWPIQALRDSCLRGTIGPPTG